jgi:hypothetical protein
MICCQRLKADRKEGVINKVIVIDHSVSGQCGEGRKGRGRRGGKGKEKKREKKKWKKGRREWKIKRAKLIVEKNGRGRWVTINVKKKPKLILKSK